MSTEPLAIVETDNAIDWQAIADVLAGALRTTMLRNPELTPRDWARGAAALERYDGASRGEAAEFPKASDA